MNISNFRNQLDALKKAIPPAPSAAADLRKLSSDEQKHKLAAEFIANPELVAELAATLTDVRQICTLRLFSRSLGLEEYLPAPSAAVVAYLRDCYQVTETTHQ